MFLMFFCQKKLNFCQKIKMGQDGNDISAYFYLISICLDVFTYTLISKRKHTVFYSFISLNIKWNTVTYHL
ncbi:hypothetical protein HMPREF1991_03098 [Hoylesella loescheii DSM 19665 = JCM 12249 = ATCC 15930]|uniref:Uncharacterized protein n=1 Tax=Hoylesella loescheii DSM 19665 = JCM 12249 = ATCC 15930 TaxID=1122985 RepID=A0A069QDW4_HOYLO|nr:hypothetical protein HMPREF1991_03098 [Hoylesella loescheii DSM 19665 = JCM 12249 = ATCC 15930]